MGLIMILLVIGLCGFLFWFFDAILKDIWADEECEPEVVYLRRKHVREISCADSSEEEDLLKRPSHVA